MLSGDDALTVPMMSVGASGVISVTSNVRPREVSRATRLALDGHAGEALRAHLALVPLHEAMFLDPNPAPVKAALALKGMMREGVRSPLVPCSDTTRRAVAAAMNTYAKGKS